MSFERYKSNTSGLEIVADVTGMNFQPRFFCDDSATVFTSKPGVAKLKMSPVVQFINTNISYDVSQSNHPTGTFSTFDIAWGGTTDIGDLSAQSWAGSKTGNVQYTTVGIYTASLTLTDTLGNVSQPAKQKIIIVDQIAAIARVFIATDDSGVYVYDPGGTPTQSNTGLTGDYLKVNSLAVNPHFSSLPAANQHVWIATVGGVAYSTDGAANWTTITPATLGDPTNSAGDGAPPDTDDLDQIAIAFDPQDWRRVYLLRATKSTWNASNDPRIFRYMSTDYGPTWASVGIGKPLGI